MFYEAFLVFVLSYGRGEVWNGVSTSECWLTHFKSDRTGGGRRGRSVSMSQLPPSQSSFGRRLSNRLEDSISPGLITYDRCSLAAGQVHSRQTNTDLSVRREMQTLIL